MKARELGVPQYAADSESSSESDSSYGTVVSGKELSVSVAMEEYEDDDDKKLEETAKHTFSVAVNENCHFVDPEHDTILVGLREKQKIYISGVFRLQVVKGGIVHNNIHFNASSECIDVWNPLCNSVPGIQSSFYAGWEENVPIEGRYREVVLEDLKDYICVIKVQNGFVEGLMDAGELFPDVRCLWKTSDCQKLSLQSDNCTYCILREDVDPFTPLHITNEWSETIERLNVVHKSSMHDTRMMVIGGKNSGKSTFLRLLTESFLFNGNNQSSDNELLYLDLDPGQPEYSDPDCISLTRVHRSARIFGRHLGQPRFESLRQHYVGSNSPQEVSSFYLECISDLISHLEELNQMGTSLVNLPGWIKGFGLNIMNRILSIFKPTHVVVLESKGSKRHLNDLNLDLTFNSSSRSNYKPVISTINGVSSNPDEFRFQAPQIRTFKTLAYFHRKEGPGRNIAYDFSPLLMRAPVQISYGNSGIQGFKFPEEFAGLHEKDIKTALEGTIVGLYESKKTLVDLVIRKGPYPILNRRPAEAEFVSLALVHSVDPENMFLNLYLPETHLNYVRSTSQDSWLIIRARTETPFCELLPRNNILSGVDHIPYVSFDLRKKHEHVWKVRKNVMRRGHHIK